MNLLYTQITGSSRPRIKNTLTMESKFSVTQNANLVALVGFIMLVLRHYQIGITDNELTALLGGAITIGGVIWNWVNRYKSGDLFLSGRRK